MRNFVGFCAALAVALGACSPVMESNRPDPVDLTKFPVGTKKFSVIGELGNPTGSTTEEGKTCDVYKLYTEGPKSGGKAAIAAGEIAADVVTLGLAEFIFTPVETLTKNKKHTVVFCYDQDSRLASLNEAETPVE